MKLQRPGKWDCEADVVVVGWGVAGSAAAVAAHDAGELGSIWGFLYKGACNLSEALVFGRIAGHHAAALSPGSME